MANRKENLRRKINYFLFLFSVFCYTVSFCTGSLVSNTLSVNNIVHLDANEPGFVEAVGNSESASHKIHRRDVSDDDAVCKAQEQNVQNLASKLDEVHEFINDSNTKMAIAWAGTNDGNFIIVTTSSDASNPGSTVLKSTDYGVTYKNLTKDLNVEGVFRTHNGIIRNPYDPKKVYLIGQGTFIYITETGGDSWTRITIPFVMDETLIFHTSPNYDRYLLAKDVHKTLYLSKDNGRNWKKIHDDVDKAFWGVMPDTREGSDTTKFADTAETIYFSYGAAVIEDPFLQQLFGFTTLANYTLAKSTDGGSNSKNILTNVVSFERQGKFLYASQVKTAIDKQGWRHLMISNDNGNTFVEAQLPTIEPDRFYSVMDIEDSMIFMHVDNKDDTGHGTLYTSANLGVVYSESLSRHLYPNYGDTHDFYKVLSLRGVYITSQIREDDSIHSMITYNRGGEWHNIPRPQGVPCKDETKECYLQIHGMYSMKRGLSVSPPLSESSAIGLILAHGHVADALQKTPPDVFVSRDGGYSWSLALNGPHHYAIGDHGGFLAAVSHSTPNPKVLKFSLDEGRCWHEYQFTNKTLNFTGLITEPDGNSSVVMLWGYVQQTKKWEVHVLDFKNVIKTKCQDGDYESWKAHAEHRKIEGVDISGCMLGIKETFERLKKDSWCYNGHDYVRKNSTQLCTCTREDYECDYGYYRPGGSEDCVEEKEFKGPEIDICLHGHDEKLVSQGFRKIPGDQCVDGFHPVSKMIDLSKVCDEFGKAIVKQDETAQGQTGESGVQRFGTGIKIIAILIAGFVFVLIAIMGVYFARKYILLNRHKTEYRYSMLSQGEQQNLMADHDDDEDDDDDAQGNLERDLDRAFDTKYHDSDEELNTTTRPSSTRQNGSAKKLPKPKPTSRMTTAHDDTNPFGSFHDDSDDDMLS